MSYTALGQIAQKGIAQHAALMAECLSRGGEWTGTSCLLPMPGAGPGPATSGGGSVQALPMPSTRRAKVNPLLLAAVGAAAIVGGAWWWTRRKR